MSSMTGKHHRAATCAAIREKALKRCEDPAYRAQLSEQAKKAWENPDYRQKTVKAIREGWKKRAIALGKPLPKPTTRDMQRGRKNAQIAEAYLARHGFKTGKM